MKLVGPLDYFEIFTPGTADVEYDVTLPSPLNRDDEVRIRIVVRDDVDTKEEVAEMVHVFLSCQHNVIKKSLKVLPVQQIMRELHPCGRNDNKPLQISTYITNENGSHP